MDSEQIRHNIHYGLLARLLLYIVLLVIILGLLIYHVVLDDSGITLPATALFIGFIVGIFFSRISKISWDKNAEKVISSLDTFGIYVLCVYILYAIFREKIVEYFVHGAAVAATSFALLSGTMIGRVIGIRRKIRTVLEENT